MGKMVQPEINQLFVTLALATLLKKLGFNIPCFGFYNEEFSKEDVIVAACKNYNDLSWVRTWRNSPNDDIISAPMHQQVADWLRQVHKIDMWIKKVDDTDSYFGEVRVDKTVYSGDRLVGYGLSDDHYESYNKTLGMVLDVYGKSIAERMGFDKLPVS